MANEDDSNDSGESRATLTEIFEMVAVNTKKSRSRDSTEVAATLQEIFPSARIKSMQIIRKLSQKKSCFKVLFFRSGIKGIFKDFQQTRSSQRSPRNSDKLVLKVMMLTTPFPSVVSLLKNVDGSLKQDGSLVLVGVVNSKVGSVQRDASKSSQGMTSLLQPRNHQPSNSKNEFFS